MSERLTSDFPLFPLGIVALPSELVRLTSIYSKEDGVVRWENSMVPEADCVEVQGSHVGLVFNRKAYRAIADALARPELAAADSAKEM